jgi:hypothetical protein
MLSLPLLQIDWVAIKKTVRFGVRNNPLSRWLGPLCLLESLLYRQIPIAVQLGRDVGTIVEEMKKNHDLDRDDTDTTDTNWGTGEPW